MIIELTDKTHILTCILIVETSKRQEDIPCKNSEQK